MIVVARLERLQVGTLALLKHHPQRCHCFVASVVEGGVLGSFECCFWYRLVKRNTDLDLLIPFSSPSIYACCF